MGLILDMSPKALEKVLYFASYIVLDKGETDLQYKQVLSEQEYQEARESWGKGFRVGMGAESILELLQAIDLEKRIRRSDRRPQRRYRTETCTYRKTS